MEDEFDTLPIWTADAVEELGPEYAVPAGCRGSGTPEGLRWLSRSMGLLAGTRLLDSGAGEGGPAELAAREFGVSPVLVDPKHGACRAARRMFHRPTLVAGGERLPFPGGAFDAAWSLGVLCTVSQKHAVLTELRRVVPTGASVGLLVFVRTVDTLPDQPEGNDFPDRVELGRLLRAARLHLTVEATLSDFSEPPSEWHEKVDEVDDLVRQRHADDERLMTADHQQRIMGRLLDDGVVEGRLLVTRAF
ncbi:Methyltransferase domain-containing protein [Nocardioides alpinus]|nr:methyltransferase domain-containing protein [Nocardioides alpinus]SFB48718.1 Methyltransferase domain-containing protein [Nocardioides alpinus]